MKWLPLEENPGEIPVWEHIGTVTDCDIEFDAHVQWGGDEILTATSGQVFSRTGTITDEGFSPGHTFPADGHG